MADDQTTDTTEEEVVDEFEHPDFDPFLDDTPSPIESVATVDEDNEIPSDDTEDKSGDEEDLEAEEETGEGPEDTVDTEDPGAGHDDEDALPKGVQRRINKITRARREAEREAAHWRSIAENHGENKEEEPGLEPEPAVAAEKPKVDDFEDYDDYVEALTDYKTEQKFAAYRAEQDAIQEAEEQEQQKAEIQSRFAEGRDRYEDFDDVVLDSDVEYPQETLYLMGQSEYAADIAYLLGQNPDEAAELAASPPLEQAKAIGALETIFAGGTGKDKPDKEDPEPKPAPRRRKTTKAPPPISRLSGRGGGISKDPSDMTTTEYARYYNERQRKNTG